MNRPLAIQNPPSRSVLRLLFGISLLLAFMRTNAVQDKEMSELINSLSGATSSNDIPPLAPPLPEIPPTFWELHGLTVIGFTILLLALVSGALWLALRPKPTAPTPPEVQAREQLMPLVTLPEDGALLSRVSQLLRQYLIAAYNLPAGEPTTTEFCDALMATELIGPELATAVSGFLRACDERKFSPTASGKPLGAASQALKLVELAEARKALRRQQAQASQPA